MVYTDLNMVRAGVIQHPSVYKVCGYNEIHNHPNRYSIIDRKTLLELLAIKAENRLQQIHHEWVGTELKRGRPMRKTLWSEFIAVGKESFLKDIQQELGGRAQGRSTVIHNGTETILKEPQVPYNALFSPQKSLLSLKNTYFIEINVYYSGC